MSLKLNILLDLEQRQKAAGITTAWDAGDPTNPAKLVDTTDSVAYTYAQIRSYGNGISNQFLLESESWGHGSAAAPSTCGTEYFTADDDTWEEIAARLLTLKRTRASVPQVGSSLWLGEGGDTTVSAAVAAAATAYASTYPNPTWRLAKTWRVTGSGPYSAVVATERCTFAVTDVRVADGITKTARLYVQFRAYASGAGTWDTQGITALADAGEYALLLEEELAADDSSVTFDLSSVIPSTIPPNSPTTVEDRGFESAGTADHVGEIVCEWAFADYAGGPNAEDWDAGLVFSGQVVISRQGGRDELWLASYDAEGAIAWTLVTGDVEFPADPGNGDLYQDETHDVEWTWVEDVGQWRAAYRGRQANPLAPGVRLRRITVPAGATDVVFELSRDEVPNADVLLGLVVQLEWASTTPAVATNHTHRSALLSGWDAPTYASAVTVLYHGIQEVE